MPSSIPASSTPAPSAIIHPFILSGGSGTRLWPLSRRSYPKQFLSLTDAPSLFQQTVQRLQGAGFAAPSVLANHNHRFIIAEQMQAVGTMPDKIILEPAARNTAPAALIAALVLAEKDEEAAVLLLPSDHAIRHHAAFRDTVRKGLADIAEGHLVTFGIQPDAPETGYGYIETRGTGARRDVIGFVEKPDLATAERYVAAGHFLWNAGIFLFRAKDMIAAFARHAPTFLAPCRTALAKAREDLDFLRLERESYMACQDMSLDYAIMEKADHIRCLSLKSDWHDLGTWSAIWQAGDKDGNGNVCQGDVILHATRNSYAHSTEGACLALLGLDDVFAIATKDAVLLAHKDAAQDVKQIVDMLGAQQRLEAVAHKRIYRPWGWYETLSRGARYQVKVMLIKPGMQLSLQSHFHRAEHWVVVRGTVQVTLDDRDHLLTENESIYIPIGAQHRLANPGKLPAMLIEVQSGSYLEEDDIIRYHDDFGRQEVRDI